MLIGQIKGDKVIKQVVIPTHLQLRGQCEYSVSLSCEILRHIPDIVLSAHN